MLLKAKNNEEMDDIIKKAIEEKKKEVETWTAGCRYIARVYFKNANVYNDWGDLNILWCPGYCEGDFPFGSLHDMIEEEFEEDEEIDIDFRGLTNLDDLIEMEYKF